MTVINDSTVVVFSSAELKSAILDVNYVLIYLGADITLTSGIAIPSNKLTLTIDGTYLDVRHTFTDMKSLTTGDTINVASASTTKVIIRNMDITGYNYYGIVYVPEASVYKNTVVSYENITYVGPQISFNPWGLTRFIDSTLTIQENYAAGNEVAECNRIEIGGTTTITHKSMGNSSFWFRNSNPSLTILASSMVTLSSASRELIYGVNNLLFTIQANAYFKVTVRNGLGYNNFGTGITNILENASFILEKTAASGSYATWYSYGKISLYSGSTLRVINDFTGITTSNYNIYFSGSSASFSVDNPKEVLLYNRLGQALYTDTSILYSFTFSRINLFNDVIVPTDNSMSSFPTFSWYKDSASQINGNFLTGSTTVTSSNFTEAELANLPALSNFSFQNKKIISMGTFYLHINRISDTATSIKGVTLPNASVLISYDDISNLVTAASDGSFVYNYSEALAIGTEITFNVKEYDNLIYKTKMVTVIYHGDITLTGPDAVTFLLSPVSLEPLLCARQSELTLTVVDSRVNSTVWHLYASVNHDLVNSDGHYLPSSIIFLDDDNVVKPLSSDKTLIYTGAAGVEEETKTTEITFKVDEGILLQILEPVFNETTYTALINWEIETEE